MTKLPKAVDPKTKFIPIPHPTKPAESRNTCFLTLPKRTYPSIIVMSEDFGDSSASVKSRGVV